jgi:uncharacterized membrane protein affecting hemolysin expression
MNYCLVSKVTQKRRIVDTMFVLTLTVIVTLVCVGLYQELSKSNKKSEFFHSPSYQAITNQAAHSISLDLTLGEIHAVKRKISQFVIENRVSFMRVYDNNGFLIIEYRNNNFITSSWINNDASEKKQSNIVEVSSIIVNRSENVGYIEIGFPRHLNLASVVQNNQSTSAHTVKNVILVCVFSFVLGIYLTNIYVKIKVRLAEYESRTLNRTARTN